MTSHAAKNQVSTSSPRFQVFLSSGGKEKVARAFDECLVHKCGVRGTLSDSQVEYSYASYDVKGSHLLLRINGIPSEEVSSEEKKVPFAHPHFCPVREYRLQYQLGTPNTQLEKELPDRDVSVGSVILLHTSDEAVLLTKRASHLRTFPGVWVPPGGHVEVGETLVEAGLRELWEEVGLRVTADAETPSPPPGEVVALWESVYPPHLKYGPPLRHHVVTYVHYRVPDTAAQLLDRVQLDYDDVSRCVFVPLNALSGLFRNNLEATPATVSGVEVAESGSQRSCKVDLRVFASNVTDLPDQGDAERISTGTRFALDTLLGLVHIPMA